MFGKPFKLYDSIAIASQKVTITFVQQTENAVMTELVQPAADNLPLQKNDSERHYGVPYWLYDTSNGI